jgi:HK97 family phage portal protein
MRFFNALREIFSMAGERPATNPITDDRLWVSGQSQTISGVSISPEKSLTLSTYFACVRNIAEDISKLPLKVYSERPDGGKDTRKDHPLYRLLHDQPNPEMASQTFRETLTAWALGWGNGIAVIERAGTKVVALWPKHPSFVAIKRDAEGDIVYVVREPNKAPAVYDRSEVFHLRGLGSDVSGYPISYLARESVGLGLAAQNFGAAFYGNGAMPGGVLEHPAKLSPEAHKRLRESWESVHQGAENAHKIAVLEEGMKFGKMSIPPEEAQFLESREFQTEEICRWFRMPPHKAGHLKRATFSNIEHQGIEYVSDTLMPWGKRWESEVKMKLMAENEPGLYAEHSYTSLLQADSLARAQFYTSQFQVGALSPNEIRALENRNPIEDGDKHFVQLNLTTLEKAGMQQPNAPEAQEIKEDGKPT